MPPPQGGGSGVFQSIDNYNPYPGPYMRGEDEDEEYNEVRN